MCNFPCILNLNHLMMELIEEVDRILKVWGASFVQVKKRYIIKYIICKEKFGREARDVIWFGWFCSYILFRYFDFWNSIRFLTKSTECLVRPIANLELLNWSKFYCKTIGLKTLDSVGTYKLRETTFQHQIIQQSASPQFPHTPFKF